MNTSILTKYSGLRPMHAVRETKATRIGQADCQCCRCKTQSAYRKGSRQLQRKSWECSAAQQSVLAAAVQQATQQPELDLAKMEPLADRVLVKPVEASDKSDGGIIMASSSQQAMGISDAVIGEVIAIGSEVEVKVQKGDKVIYSKYSSSDIPAKDGDVTFVAQKSILAKLS